MTKTSLRKRFAAFGMAVLATSAGTQAMAAMAPLSPEDKAYLQGIDDHLAFRQQNQQFTAYHANDAAMTPAARAAREAGDQCVQNRLPDAMKRFGAPQTDIAYLQSLIVDNELGYNKIVTSAALLCAEFRMIDGNHAFPREVVQMRSYCNDMYGVRFTC